MNSTAHRPASPVAVFLAGLQAGMIGICWMLAWLGLSAMGQSRSFWTAENLMASVFHGGAAIRRGFGCSTLSGIALYLLVYSLLGAGFAVAVRNRFTGLGTVLLGVLFSVGWYCLWFRALGQTLMPLVWLLHAESSTAFGHVIFGAWLARFPAYLPKPEPPAADGGVAEQSDEAIPTDPQVSGAEQLHQLQFDFFGRRVELADAEAADLAAARAFAFGSAALAALPAGLQHVSQGSQVGIFLLGFLFFPRSLRPQPASGVDPFAQFHLGARTGNIGHAARRHVAFLVLGDIFVEAGGNQLPHAETQTALLDIEFEHLRLDYLPGVQHVLGMIDALLGADIAHVDHALDALGHLHERAELLDAGHRALDHRAHGKFLRRVGPGIAQRLFETERNAPVRRIDAEHDHVHRIAGVDHIGGLAHLLGPGHLGEMHQAFDALLQFDESAEIGDARHATLDALAYLVLVGDQVPGVRLELLEPERNAFLAGIDLEDARLHLVADLEDVGGLVDAAPGDVGHMQQGIDAADIDEGAVIGQAAHRALHGLAFLDLGVALVLVGALFLFEDGAAVHHHIFIGDIELDDAAADFLADELFHFGGISSAATRRRHEGANTHIDADATFDHGGDHAGDGGLVGEHLLQRGPVLRPLHLEAGKLVVALLVAALDGDRHLVAQLGRVAGGLELGEGNGAFGLVADIEEDRFAGDGDYRALQSALTLFAYAMGVRLFVLGENIAKRLVRLVSGWGLRIDRPILIHDAWVGHGTFSHIVA